MEQRAYAYSAEPTRNPLRYLLALWRATRDLSATDEVAIVEIGFARSRLGRRFARWEAVLEALRRDPRTAQALGEQRLRFGPIDLGRLASLPQGTLGRSFADHCRARALDPNLVRIPEKDEVDRLLSHLFSTHDVWHVATGFGNDEVGEVGLGAFYLAQLPAPFFAFLFAFILLNTVFVKPQTLRERMEALVAGYEAGRNSEPLFGVDWEALWDVPLHEVRARLGLANVRVLGEGLRVAA